MSSISIEKFRDGFNRLDARSKYHITSEIIKQHSHATVAVFLLAVEQVRPSASASLPNHCVYISHSLEQSSGRPTLASSLELIGNISLLEVAAPLACPLCWLCAFTFGARPTLCCCRVYRRYTSSFQAQNRASASTRAPNKIARMVMFITIDGPICIQIISILPILHTI